MSDDLLCIRCKMPVVKNREYYEIFEKMHWLCFHLEYEHSTDPDEPCIDPSCPWRHLEIYEKKLKELGENPVGLINNVINNLTKDTAYDTT